MVSRRPFVVLEAVVAGRSMRMFCAGACRRLPLRIRSRNVEGSISRSRRVLWTLTLTFRRKRPD